MRKPKLRVWPRIAMGDQWTVQHKPWWSPCWRTVGTYDTAEMARLAIKEMEKTE